MTSLANKNSSKTNSSVESSNSNNSNNTHHNSDRNIRRAVRQLRRSARRLVRRDDGWAVTHYGHPVAVLTPEETAFLAAEGHVVEAQGGGYVIASATTDEATSAPDVPVTGAWVFAAAGAQQSSTPGRGFEKLARKASRGDGPLTLRQAEAGLRLIADAEYAASTPGLTMDWSNTIRDHQRRRASDGGATYMSRAASRRLEKITLEAGSAAFMLAWRCCVERHTIVRLARAAGVAPKTLLRRLSVALEAIAEAYNMCG